MQLVSFSRTATRVTGTAIVLLACTFGATASVDPGSSLGGEYLVPPLASMAAGSSDIVVGDDMTVTGTIQTSGIIDATSAHIHEGKPGASGPIIVTMAQELTSRWVVPPGTTLTKAQFASYLTGNLYVDVHTAAHPNGEIRRQLNH